MNNEFFSLPIVEKDQEKIKILNWSEIIKIIKNHHFFLLSTIGIMTASVFVISFFLTPIYETTSRIIIDTNSDTWIKKNHQEYFDSNVNTVLYQTKYKLLQSRELYEKLIHSDELIKDPEFKQWIEKSKKKYQIKNFDKKISIKEKGELIDSLLIDQVREKINILLVPNTQIVEIRAKSESPFLSQKIANIFALESCDYDNKWSQVIYNDALDKIKKKINSSWLEIKRMSEIKNKLNNINFKKEVFLDQDSYEKIVMSNINSLQLLQYERKKIQSEHSKKVNSDFLKIRDEDDLINVNKKIVNSKAELASLSQVFTNNHPMIISLRRKIDQLSNISENIRYEKNKEIKMWIESKIDLEKNFDQEIQQMINNYNNASPLRDSFKMIEKKIEVKFKIYQQLLDLYENIRINKETNTQKIRFIDRAELPISPVAPDVVKNTILTAVFSSFFSIVYVLIRKI